MKTLYTVNEVSQLINQGQSLLLAGDESLLVQLPKGSWIGGTIPYFMTENGGLDTREKIQVAILPDFISSCRITHYKAEQLKHIPQDYESNGVSFITLPAFSNAHHVFAKECSTYSGLFDRPLIGWVTGFHLQSENVQAKTINGKTGEVFTDEAVVMHINLPDDKFGKVNILNLFKQGSGDVIRFLNTGFEVDDCFINGVRHNFYDYLTEKKIDTQVPLVANYSGAMINASFKSLDEKNKIVHLYAPIFSNIDYRIARPIENYEQEFVREVELSKIKNPVFSCNCILNYLYANLQGKKTGDVVGPMTFGEIAYMLLNQTMVYITFEDRAIG